MSRLFTKENLNCPVAPAGRPPSNISTPCIKFALCGSETTLRAKNGQRKRAATGRAGKKGSEKAVFGPF